MHYITMGILIGIGIMLAPLVVELTIALIRAIPTLLFGATVLAAVAAGVYGMGWVVAHNAGDPGFWVLVGFSTLSAFLLFWPRRKTDGLLLIRTRGLLAGSAVLLVAGIGIVIGATLVAALIMENWRDPAFWLGSSVFVAIAVFVIVTARRGRSEEERQRLAELNSDAEFSQKGAD